MAADTLDVRIVHLERAYEQTDRRLGAVKGRIAARRKGRRRFAHVRTEIQSVRGELLGRMDRQFFWSWACWSSLSWCRLPSGLPAINY